MRIHGWCEKCKKFRMVRTGAPMGQRAVVIGICAHCEQDKENQEEVVSASS